MIALKDSGKNQLVEGRGISTKSSIENITFPGRENILFVSEKKNLLSNTVISHVIKIIALTEWEGRTGKYLA